MGLEGKISVTHYLNQKLKGEDGIKFPLYVRIRFRKKQTEMKSFFFRFDDSLKYDSTATFNEKSLSKAINVAGQNPFKAELSAIHDIVDLFAAKGINILEREPKLIIDRFLYRIDDVIAIYSSFRLKKMISKKYYFTESIINWDVPFSILYEGILSIIPSDAFKVELKDELDVNLALLKKIYKLPVNFKAYQWEYSAIAKKEVSEYLGGMKQKIFIEIIDKAYLHLCTNLSEIKLHPNIPKYHIG